MSWRRFVSQFNDPGVPVPVVEDPVTHKGSITATMVVVSFGLCALGVVGKYSKMLGDIDLTAAHSLLAISLSAYLGRQYQKSQQAKDPDDSKP